VTAYGHISVASDEETLSEATLRALGQLPDQVRQELTRHLPLDIQERIAGIVAFAAGPSSDPGIPATQVDTARKVEQVVGAMSHLLDEVETVRHTRDDLLSEIQQLEAIRSALGAELMKRSGPDRRITSMLARASQAILQSMLVGVAGGAAQAQAQRLLSDQEVVQACEVVQTLADSLVGDDHKAEPYPATPVSGEVTTAT
jgi:hypothetical protein